MINVILAELISMYAYEVETAVNALEERINEQAEPTRVRVWNSGFNLASPTENDDPSRWHWENFFPPVEEVQSARSIVARLLELANRIEGNTDSTS